MRKMIKLTVMILTTSVLILISFSSSFSRHNVTGHKVPYCCCKIKATNPPDRKLESLILQIYNHGRLCNFRFPYRVFSGGHRPFQDLPFLKPLGTKCQQLASYFLIQNLVQKTASKKKLHFFLTKENNVNNNNNNKKREEAEAEEEEKHTPLPSPGTRKSSLGKAVGAVENPRVRVMTVLSHATFTCLQLSKR